MKSLRHRAALVACLVLFALGSLWLHKRQSAGPGQPGRVVNLGLDLQGGIHLALELDQSERVSDDLDRDLELALAVLRKRIDEFGVTERLVQRVGTERIAVELPGVSDPARARAVVQRTAFLEFRFTEATGSFDRALPSLDRALRAAGPSPSAAGSAVGRLLGGDADGDPAGFLATRIAPGPVPGSYRVPESEWRAVDSALRRPDLQRLLPRGVELRWGDRAVGAERALYALEDRPVLTGASLVDARAGADPLTGGSEVRFELDRAGARRFGEATGRHVGRHLAILLDGRVQGTPPVVESRIDRQGRIQMAGRPLAEAQDVAVTLRAGALPLPLTIVEQHEIGPSLGDDSVRGGLTAGVAGAMLVVAVMVGCYAWSGVLAVGALAIYSLLCFATLALFGAALTLPGLAGFVLSLGMAVDANVLVFERIREEREAGRGARAAVAEGFRHAMPAIVDSILTTVLTALFLYRFGTGPVQGFAVTLVVGILASMVTAVFVTRTFVEWRLRRAGPDAPLSLGSWRPFRNASFDFLGRTRVAAVLTAAVLVVGVAGAWIRGPNYGVDFEGGTRHQVELAQVTDPALVRSALIADGIEGAEVQRFGGPRSIAIRAPSAGDLDASVAQVSRALTDAVGVDGFRLARSETVGPKVGAELRERAVAAVLLSFVAVLGYLAWRFEWRFGLAAVVATSHDVAVVTGLALALGLEINLVLVAALLTVVGYSLNDTIVIFDRVRERLAASGGRDLDAALNGAVNDTLPRTLLTGGTALLTLVALWLFGGPVIRPFALVMGAGIVVGTFSSVYVAPPVLRAVTARWPGRTRAAVTAPPHMQGT